MKEERNFERYTMNLAMNTKLESIEQFHNLRMLFVAFERGKPNEQFWQAKGKSGGFCGYRLGYPDIKGRA